MRLGGHSHHLLGHAISFLLEGIVCFADRQLCLEEAR